VAQAELIRRDKKKDKDETRVSTDPRPRGGVFISGAGSFSVNRRILVFPSVAHRREVTDENLHPFSQYSGLIVADLGYSEQSREVLSRYLAKA
jgi:hypothetical protein